jgi:hypothetical protein
VRHVVEHLHEAFQAADICPHGAQPRHGLAVSFAIEVVYQVVQRAQNERQRGGKLVRDAKQQVALVPVNVRQMFDPLLVSHVQLHHGEVNGDLVPEVPLRCELSSC